MKCRDCEGKGVLPSLSNEEGFHTGLCVTCEGRGKLNPAQYLRASLGALWRAWRRLFVVAPF